MIPILLDSCTWIWLASDKKRLSAKAKVAIAEARAAGAVNLSVFSCWEVAKLVEYDHLSLPKSPRDWLTQALDYPGVALLELTPDIVIDSTSLPGTFHRDPADQLIVATARIYNAPLVTSDSKLLSYPHVETIG